MNEEDRAAKDRDAARRRRMELWLLVFAAGVCLLAAGVALLAYDGARQGWGLPLMGAGVLPAVFGLLMTLRYRPNADTERTLRSGGYRDHLQRQRAQSILIMPLTSLFLTFKSVEGTWEILNGVGSRTDWMLIPLSPMISILILLMIAGLDNPGDIKMKRLLEDELTLSFRHRTLGLALLVLVGGLLGAFGLALWRPAVGITAMPLVLAVASAAAAIRYAMLNREADPHG